MLNGVEIQSQSPFHDRCGHPSMHPLGKIVVTVTVTVCESRFPPPAAQTGSKQTTEQKKWRTLTGPQTGSQSCGASYHRSTVVPYPAVGVLGGRVLLLLLLGPPSWFPQFVVGCSGLFLTLNVVLPLFFPRRVLLAKAPVDDSRIQLTLFSSEINEGIVKSADLRWGDLVAVEEKPNTTISAPYLS